MSLVNVVRLLRLPHTARDPDLVTRVAMLMDHLEDISATPALAEMWRTTAVLPLTRDLPASPYSEVATIYTIYCNIYAIYCYFYIIYCYICTIYCYIYTIYLYIYTIYC